MGDVFMPRDGFFSSAPLAKYSLAFAGLGALIFVVGTASVRETYRGWQVAEEIRGLQAEVAMLEGRQGQLTETIQRLQSPEALDKEARLRLGLQKPGERVFILRGGSSEAEPAMRRDNDTLTESNPRKWWRYFCQW